MDDRMPINPTLFGKTNAGKGALAAKLAAGAGEQLPEWFNRRRDTEPWPPLVHPAPLLDRALEDTTVDLHGHIPRHAYEAPVFLWEGPEPPPHGPSADDLRYLPVLDGHTFLYGPHCIDQAAAAARQFGGPGERCLQTTTVYAGDFQHTHVCVRKPHLIDEDHCSFTGYRWRGEA